MLDVDWYVERTKKRHSQFVETARKYKSDVQKKYTVPGSVQPHLQFHRCRMVRLSPNVAVDDVKDHRADAEQGLLPACTEHTQPYVRYYNRRVVIDMIYTSKCVRMSVSLPYI